MRLQPNDCLFLDAEGNFLDVQPHQSARSACQAGEALAAWYGTEVIVAVRCFTIPHPRCPECETMMQPGPVCPNCNPVSTVPEAESETKIEAESEVNEEVCYA